MGGLSRILAGLRRSRSRQAEDPYRAGEFVTFPAGGGQVVAQAAATDAARVVPAALADFLESCTTFAPLDEHLRRWRQTDEGSAAGPLDDPGTLAAALLREGFLVSARTLWEAAQRTAGPPDRRPITALGIVTCDRPDPLATAVASHLEAAARAGRALDLVIVDDTGDAAARALTRARLETLAPPAGVTVWYAGREEKERFARALAGETGAPPDLIGFTLFDPEGCGWTTGANRNALLLHTAGELLFTADDDVQARVAPVPGEAGGLALVSIGDPTQFTFFPDRPATLAGVRFGDLDPLAAHEGLLGAGLAACVAAQPGPEALDLSEVGPAVLTHLLRGRGRVRLTLSGLVGDPGIGSPEGLLMLHGPSRQRLVASEAAYRAATTSREVLRAVIRPTVGEAALAMTPAIGLDNRDPLPPFFPVRRNQDGVFGLVTRLALADTLTGYLPHALLHTPPESRRFQPDEAWAGAGRLLVTDIVIDFLASLVPLAAPPGVERLRAIGRRLGDLGALPAADFRQHVERGRGQRLGRRLVALEQLLAEHGDEPAWWARDVRRQLDTLRGRAADDDLDLPGDLPGRRSPDEIRALTRRLVRRYGELIEAWPEIVEGTRRLRARGVRVARPVAGRRP